MWYFSWILGLAVGFGILNGLWHEFGSDPDDDSKTS
jgi:cyd operon protein YbgT